jgi:GTP-binding protein EngB required for normal cell division
VSRELDRRLSALAEAVELGAGRIEPERLEHADVITKRAGERLGLGVEATVVALAGPTGAGKSSLFNALAGSDLVATSRRRPTTSSATAAVWGEPPDALLEWLEVPLRHRLDGEPRGLVLLDLPDFDSVEHSHRLEVERMIRLVDLFVWVVDPQKYADSALHDRYLRPLAGYARSMVVVLNQADLLEGPALAACRRDLEQTLGHDGLEGVTVLAVSARTGAGLDELHRLLAASVARREAALARLSSDVSATAAALGAQAGAGKPGTIGRRESEVLVAALADAAGAPTVVGAVERAHRRRGSLATGWPFVRWVRRLRPDPLRRLRVAERDEEPDTRLSLPAPTAMQHAQVDSANRTAAASAAGDLEAPWPGVLRSAATAREGELAKRLERAVAGTKLNTRAPLWWRLAGLLQVALAAVVVAGALWLLTLVALGFLRIEDAVPLPEVEGFALPTLMLAGGAVLGLMLAALTRLVNGVSSRRRGRAARRALHASVDAAARELVLVPLEDELEVHRRLGEALEVASGGRRLRRRASSAPGLPPRAESPRLAAPGGAGSRAPR